MAEKIPPAAFVCAICEREVIDWPWVRFGGRDGHIPPLCAACETRKPDMIGLGSPMDRRMARRVLTLAEALNGTAHRIIWRAQYGRA